MLRIYLFLLVIVMYCPPGVRAQVSSVFPTSQERSADRGTDITIQFDQPVQPASVTEMDLFVFGRWSGVAGGTLAFEENNATLRFTPARPFMAGEWVTVSLSRDIEMLDGSMLPAGYTWNFWTETTGGNFSFVKIDDLSTRMEGERLVRSYGAYAGDLNRDGFSDLMIPNEVANDIRIFYNDGTGGYDDFVTYPIPAGSVPSTNEGSDFNRDGYIDFAIGNTGNDLVSVWMGEESGAVHHDANATADDNVRGLCVLDLNGDAVMDIVTANRTGAQDDGTISLLLNTGNGTFDDPLNLETESTGETACAAIDANNDGILDVFIGAYSSNEVLLFLGDGDGGLEFSDRKLSGAGPWMMAAGDLNGDGFADAVSSNTGDNTVSVMLGNGDGTLQDAKNYPTGQFPLAIDVGDLDGDGDLDVVTSNFSSNNYTVLENTGDGALTQRLTLPAATAASCTILHDRDNDGDLDITGIDELADRVFLFDSLTEPVALEEDMPGAVFLMHGSYPNPFKTATSLSYSLDKSAAVDITIYNMLGQQVRAFFSAANNPGKNKVLWDGNTDAGKPALPGMYIFRIATPNAARTGTLIKL